MQSSVHALVGLVVNTLRPLPRRARDERGLSQSTENAILLAGAVALAGTVVSLITIYVKARIPK